MSWKRWAGAWFALYLLIYVLHEPQYLCSGYEVNSVQTGVVTNIPRLGDCVEYMRVGPSSATVGSAVATFLLIPAYGTVWIARRFDRQIWRGTSLLWKFGVLSAFAVLVQFLASPDPVTWFDLVVTPFTAAIWLAVGWLLWKGYLYLNDRFGWSRDDPENEGDLDASDLDDSDHSPD